MSARLAPQGEVSATPLSVLEIRKRWRTQRDTLIECFEANSRTRSLLVGLREAADVALRSLYTLHHLPASYCLVAVGGFGRGELFPYSDIDVLLIVPTPLEEMHEAEKSAIESFVTGCWDAGLEIGFAVRTVQECVSQAERDVTIQTAMLEARRVAGSSKLFQQFETAYYRVLNPQEFFQAKLTELKQRHIKFDDTPYALEPNCKESPGGLRDLHFLLWAAHAAGLGQGWDAMAARGLLTRFELQQLKANEALLKLVRARLHIAAKRREDRLVFDLQTAVSQAFGYEQKPQGKRASEQLMQRYYWAAKAVTQLHQVIRQNIEERLFPQNNVQVRKLNAHFGDKGGMLEVLDDKLYQREPERILETFHTIQQHEGIKGLSARTWRALYNARRVMDSRFRNDPVNHATFRKILQHGEGLTHAMRLMNQTSVLGRYLWVFRRIVGQMQHDLFHVYTVDQHILMVLRNMRRFAIPEHTHEYPFCSQLMAQFEKHWVLYIAALFHDIAKGRGGDHSELGTVEVHRFCKVHGIAKVDTQLIEFLVREHLQMSRVAQKEDLSDPDVIKAFAARVGNERYLTALYLLTVADVRGTSPKVWNAWKGKLLEDLYKLTLRVLGGHEPNRKSEIESRQQEALADLSLHAIDKNSHVALWNTLDVSYFLRHEASDIAWHARQLYEHVHSTVPVVRARLSRGGEVLQVLVYTPDQADVFTRICGYFDSHNFSILDAKIHTTNKKYALDTFMVEQASLVEHYRELVSQIEAELPKALEQQSALPLPNQINKGRVSRRVKSFPITPRVELRPDERAQRWLLTVSASDRAGLLYGISLVLARHSVNLQLAKVTTLGERVEDTFLIDGDALSNIKEQSAIEQELLEAVAA
jgi:[protein-PII] uridylyltransferase